MSNLKQDYRNLEKINKEEFEELVQNIYDRDPENFLLVKVGANDGWMCDNLYDFVIKNDPKAVMIEPIPCYFEALKENFKDLKNMNYENVAVDTKEGTREMTYIPDQKFQNEEVTFRLAHMPELLKEHWARGLGSFYKDKNNLGCPELAKHTTTIDVTTKTSRSILEKYGVNEKTNLVFSTDCEGHDYEILRSFDFGAFTPILYICEIVHFTRYPLSHPRRKEYINEEETPDGRPRLPDEHFGISFDIPPQVEYLLNNLNLSEDKELEMCWKMFEDGIIPPPQLADPLLDVPQNKEYLQEDGLYTKEEFETTIQIFNKNGYTVRDQSYDGDIIAIFNDCYEMKDIKCLSK